MHKQVLQNIQEDIIELSDIGRQKKYWLGQDPEHVSSFVELYARLFDDNRFDDFVDMHAAAMGYSGEFIAALHLLRGKLNAYEEKGTEAAILSDDKWLDVVECAKYVMTLWDSGKQI